MSDRSTSNKKHGIFDQFPPVTREVWEKKAVEDLKGGDYDTLRWRPYEGFEIEPFYLKDDLDSLSYLIDSAPGEYPYSRGAKTDDNDWEVCEYISVSSVEGANKVSLKAMEAGACALTFQCNYDQNSITGIPLQNSNDMQVLLSDIPVNTISVNFEPGSAGPEILSLFLSECLKKGFSTKELKGNMFYDPLRDLSIKGSSDIPLDTIYRDISSLIRYADSKLPGYRCLCVDSSEFHESGGSTVQELAFTLSKGVEYMVRLTELGMDPGVVAGNIVFSFPVGSSYFMEVAKFRAARILWSKLVSEFSRDKKLTGAMHIHARTDMWNKTIYDPYVNMLRGTVECMIAAVSGCSSFTVIPMDRIYETPTEFTRRMAANTQHIIKEESYINRVIDPVAGSYYVENLTDLMVQDAFKLFLETEENGGFAESLRSGFIQDRISQTAESKNRDIEKRKLVLLGTNRFPDNNEKMLKYLANDNLTSEIVLTGNEPNDEEKEGIEELIKTFENGDVNVGDCIRLKISGDGPKVRQLVRYRAAEVFERIRLATEKYVGDDQSKRPKVFLLKFGNLAARNARASFARNLFGCAGYEILEDPGYEDIDKGTEAALDSGSAIVVLCSSDKQYPDNAAAVCSKINDNRPDIRIILAGYPKDHVEDMKNSGVDDFIYSGCNAVKILEKYQKTLGVIS